MTECCDLLLDRLRRSLRPNLFVLSVLLSLARALSAHCICTHARADMHHTHTQVDLGWRPPGTLRGGLCKIASGSHVLSAEAVQDASAPLLQLADVRLRAVGKPP